MLKRIYYWLRFWLLWPLSSWLNFVILVALRQFYMTDDVLSDYFKEVASKIDTWLLLIVGLGCLLMVYLLNAFYKNEYEIWRRFTFVTACQLFLLGVVRLTSAPFALKYSESFQLTSSYILYSSGMILTGMLLIGILIKVNRQTLVPMVKKLFRLYRDDKYW